MSLSLPASNYCTAASSLPIVLRYKEDQDRDVTEANERAKLASMTDEERRQWELANPKVTLGLYLFASSLFAVSNGT